MPAISRQEVEHVAELGHLALTEDELERVGQDLNRVLEHFRALQELDTTDVPITSHAIPMRNVYREDEVRGSLPVEEVVANAPDGLEEYFRVPRIVEE